MGSSPIRDTTSAQVAKSVDAQDLKSCGPITHTGSIPVLGTKFYRFRFDKNGYQAFFYIIRFAEKTF